MSDPVLLKTPLHELHKRMGARLVPFAGYEMPLQYTGGILAEHRQCRASAALFDVSHMGQIRLTGADADASLESLVPMDILGLGLDRQRYALFTNTEGGILDDLMVVRRKNDLLLVVNAANKAADLRHLVTSIGHRCTVVALEDRALLALQGPKAAAALAQLEPLVGEMRFMDGAELELAGTRCYLTRSGYTGEDGFEISVDAAHAQSLAETLLGLPGVALAGLGSRDTLRLEAGLCLHGHDISAGTSPVEAGLSWAIQKVRRPGGEREGRYPGAAAIASHLAGGAPRKRVGLVGLERVPVREGAPIVDARGRRLGVVTSGTLAPSVDKVIAMAYLSPEHAQPQHEVYAEVRGKQLPMRVTPMPFHPHRYQR